MGGLCVTVLALTAFSVFGRMERAVSLEAALVLPGERHYLVAPASGTVEDVFVAVTDTVAPEQPIARIRPSDAQHWESVIVGVINGLEKGDQLEEEALIELLQALLVAGSAHLIHSSGGGHQPIWRRGDRTEPSAWAGGGRRRLCGPGSCSLNERAGSGGFSLRQVTPPPSVPVWRLASVLAVPTIAAGRFSMDGWQRFLRDRVRLPNGSRIKALPYLNKRICCAWLSPATSRTLSRLTARQRHCALCWDVSRWCPS